MPELPGDPALHQAVVQRLDWLARPCAAIAVGGPVTTGIRSQLAGHPHLPPGAAWPVTESGPAVFVLQVDFAEVPALPGFPTAGLLQWFVDAGDTYGLTFDETAGRTGVHVRWYDPPYAPSPPADAPVPRAPEGYDPLDATDPEPLTFTRATSLPEWDGLPEIARADPIWGELARVNGEDPCDVAFGYHEFARGGASTYGRHAGGSKIGGFASFTQWDPRPIKPEDKPYGSYPRVGEPGWPLLVELDSLDCGGGWGDAGIAHLFGDPGALAVGDLRSVRYHWDCS